MPDLIGHLITINYERYSDWGISFFVVVPSGFQALFPDNLAILPFSSGICPLFPDGATKFIGLSVKTAIFMDRSALV